MNKKSWRMPRRRRKHKRKDALQDQDQGDAQIVIDGTGVEIGERLMV